jgi:alpha-L-arabinofuranosidase
MIWCLEFELGNISENPFSGRILMKRMGFVMVVLAALVAGVGNSDSANDNISNTLIINADQGVDTIDRNIYAHFAEHIGRLVYDGLWVGEDSPIPNTRGIRTDIVQALRNIQVPLIRWPGGSFADFYHWEDGIGPRDKRPKRISHWGVIEDNQFGTHEFLDLCEQVGCEPYICGNIGSGTPTEMRDWVEYITYDGPSTIADLRRENGREKPWELKYFGLGNEMWGSGGRMRPEFYADEYRRFQTFLNFGNESTLDLFKICAGAHSVNYEWTDVLMKEAGPMMDGISMHYYFRPAGVRYTGDHASVTRDEDKWFSLFKAALKMEGLIEKHATIMDRYDPEKRVALMVDEWGAWYDPEPGTRKYFYYQQSTMRDAIAAGMVLNIFNQHCDRVRMANIAQMINVLQAIILTDGDRMLLTPTYHVYEMYTVHHDATLLPSTLTCADYRLGDDSMPGLSVSVSRDDRGVMHISLCNPDPNNSADLTVELRGATAQEITGRILTAKDMTTHNTFDNPDVIEPVPFSDITRTDTGLVTTLPPMSVVVLESR